MSWGTWGYSGTRCKIKSGWSDAGKEGIAFGFFNDKQGQKWIVVQWDEDDDPDLHKASGLLLKHIHHQNNWENA